MTLFSRSLIPSFALPSPVTSLSDRFSPPPTADSDVSADLFRHSSTINGTIPELPEEEEEEEETETTSSVNVSADADGDEASRRKARTDLMGKALFPPPPEKSLPNAALKRLSLPTMVPTSKYSIPSPSRRKSLSPAHTASRAASLHPHSSRDSSILAEPLVRQLQTLKSRNGVLESTLSTIQGEKSSVLSKATTRIASLEQTLVEAVEEAEGWEAEAVKLGQEVEKERERARKSEQENEALRKMVEEEKHKKNRFKDVGGRLRMELGGRKLKEKWELAVMDAEDRSNDVLMVGLEYDVALLKLETGLNKLRHQELEEIIQHQSVKLLEVSASRKLLLKSFKHSESNAITLKADVARALKDLKGEKDAHEVTRTSLIQTQTNLDVMVAEMEEEREEMEAAKSALNDVEKKEKADKKGEQKELVELRKALEKEKSARTKAENEVKELKTKLKQTQSELTEAYEAAEQATNAMEAAFKTAEAATRAAQQSVKDRENSRVESPRALPSVKPTTSKKQRSVTKEVSDVEDDAADDAEADVEVEEEEPVVEDEEAEDEEEEKMDEDEEEEEVAVPVKASSKASTSAPRIARKPRTSATSRNKSRPIVVRPERADTENDADKEEEPEEDESSQELYNPAPSRSRSMSGAAPARRIETSTASSTASKKRKATSTLEKIAVPPVPKINVFRDKSTNAKSIATQAIVPLKVVRKVKEIVAEEKDFGETDAATTDKGDEPAKKKKRKLFGGPKKFNWDAFQPQGNELNALGLPIALSPIKATSGSKPILSLGKGLTGGRPSIF